MIPEGIPAAEAPLEVTPTPEEMHQRGLAAARALPADGTTPTEVTPQGEGTGAAATTEVDSFTRLDPSSIPAELRPYYDSMQADYTRKTQAIAPFRQLSEQSGLDVAGLSQAAELYSALQDPQALVEFHSELTTALEAQGLTRAEAQGVATQHIIDTQGGQPVEQGEYVDPEEARIRAMEQRLAGFEQANAAAAEAQRMERLQMNLVAEMNRQEMIVKEAHPQWDQEDIDAVYEISAFYGGDLVQAANRFDDIISSRISKILNGKGAAAANPALAPVGVGAATSRPMSFGSDLNAAHKAAMEAARQLP